MKDLIIDKPHSLKTHHKVTYLSVTFIFWAIIFYLWQPLISLVAWYFGFELFYDHMIELGGYKEFANILLIYLQVIVLLGVVFLAWAKINELRFRGKSRRKLVAVVTDSDIASYFRVEERQLKECMEQKTLSLDISDDRVIQFEPKKSFKVA
ncbi:poly-beta-1,6-N-acetyl-D-glucosamine biosynthesis protein PgaD [Kangiella profundi]|uniref:Poly-beta-1,6-N-acetyl-D-glucosamine biosynthesis protein PgaD n=1 Tax=Kangiella profundi TaxID=1561924 RepID=A0A2K9A7R6_9GAMM|nr:poly-beta-1,6-N-acetyl-D-glucosamine biosynthesis protein PgaD [Kangiella profundi]AUD78760.1 poly-beta-1,6-N-acetyl-D-glucosamine biosynthesis protein PgaD [Kangiella profundi]GGF04434.1 hypothetical protein GCM10011356_17640 [Kangiella profundi]